MNETILHSLWRYVLSAVMPARLRRNGSWLITDRDDQIIFPQLATRRFEQAEQRFLTRRLRNAALQDRILFADIGANTGLYTALAARALGSRGEVHAFEPEPRNFRLLTCTVANNDFDNVHRHALALSSEAGEVILHLNPDNKGDHSLFPSAARSDSITVPVKTLDEVLTQQHKDTTDQSGYGRFSEAFIKLDVQGAEFAVLNGASQLFSQLTDITVLFEYHPAGLKAGGTDALAMLDWFTKRSFALYGIATDGTLLPFDDSDGAITRYLQGDRFTNLVAVRAHAEAVDDAVVPAITDAS